MARAGVEDALSSLVEEEEEEVEEVEGSAAVAAADVVVAIAREYSASCTPAMPSGRRRRNAGEKPAAMSARMAARREGSVKENQVATAFPSSSWLDTVSLAVAVTVVVAAPAAVVVVAVGAVAVDEGTGSTTNRSDVVMAPWPTSSATRSSTGPRELAAAALTYTRGRRERGERGEEEEEELDELDEVEVSTRIALRTAKVSAAALLCRSAREKVVRERVTDADCMYDAATASVGEVKGEDVTRARISPALRETTGCGAM